MHNFVFGLSENFVADLVYKMCNGDTEDRAEMFKYVQEIADLDGMLYDALEFRTRSSCGNI